MSARKPGRAINTADRKRLLGVLNDQSTFHGLRTRALVLLAWSSGLRLKECCALNLYQILEDPKAAGVAWRIRSIAYLQALQSKGRRVGVKRWDSAGSFVITKPTRVALRAYLRAAQLRGWVHFPPSRDRPLFITGGRGKAHGARQRLSRRSAQHSFTQIQKRAGLAEHYQFHDLRHDAITRFGEACHGNPYKVANFGRLDPITAMRYVHTSPTALQEIAELAAR